MRITFLGTGAATSYPLAFCRCEFCAQARKSGGKDLRKRSSVLINDDLLIDLGPDLLSASFTYGLSICDIRYCLQTHPHSDHFDASHLATRYPVYGGVDITPLEIYASHATLAKMSALVANEVGTSGFADPEDLRRMRLEVIPLDKFQTVRVGKYVVTAFPANHDLEIDARLFSVSEDRFSMFYSTDTNDLPEETWRGFHEKKLRFDVVILDHTYGPEANGSSHLNADRFIEHIQRMKAEDLLSNDARIIATHISHEGNPPYSILSDYGLRHGYLVAFDGLVI